MLGETFSHYKILNELGAGGMGVVYLAEDTKLKRKVAIKILRPELAADEIRLQRFVREAETVAGLNHPNIVTIHSIEEANEMVFLTMELIEGRTLEELIPGEGMRLERFFDIAVPLADAVGTAHERGITHRDLKPGNIMVTRRGLVKVLDFGLAKLRGAAAATTSPEDPTEALTDAGRILGTVCYMSPEQVRGKHVDHRSDIFSLGIIMHEMVGGRRLFRGDTSADVISSILREEPVSVTELRGELPHHLGRIIRHCLVKDPERRYQSAQDLRNDLEDLSREVALGEARPSGELSGASAVRPRRRRRWGMVAAAGALLAVLAGGLYFTQQQPPPATQDAIAVLPFTNLTGDPAQEYLSKGISSGLTSQLGELAGARVVSRQEAARSGEDRERLRNWARRIGVGTVLEGDLQHKGDLLSVNVNLTDAETGLVVWSQAFEGPRDDHFALQRDIAQRLAKILSIPLSLEERRRLSRRPTTSQSAYQYFLMGQQYLEQVDDPTSVGLAVEMFRQALRVDQGFALAHTGLSKALWFDYRLNGNKEALVDAEKEARTALESDPGLAAAQLALARAYRTTGRSSESIRELETVLAKHPKPDEAFRELGLGYEQVGDLEQAERCLRAAAAIGGGDWFNWNTLGIFLARIGRYEDALGAFEKAGELAPTTAFGPRESLATLLLSRGKIDEALEAYALIPRPIREARLATNIGTAYYFSDRPDKWEQTEHYYRLAVRLNPGRAVYYLNLADLYRHLDRQEDAIRYYSRARAVVEAQLADNPEDPNLRIRSVLLAAKAQECESAVPLTAELQETLPATGPRLHVFAQVYALCGLEEAALDAVRRAISLGEPASIIAKEDEFRSLKGNPEYERLLEAEPQSEPSPPGL